MKSDMFILSPCHIEGSYKDIKEIEKCQIKFSLGGNK